MTDAERAEGWKKEAQENFDLALTLQGRIDGWTPEQLEAIGALIECDALFDPFRDLGDTFCLCLNMNDTFAYACADGEEITPEEAVAAHEVYKQFGHDGLTAWVAHRRGYEPAIEKIRQREKYKAAYAALAEVLAE